MDNGWHEKQKHRCRIDRRLISEIQQLSDIWLQNDSQNKHQELAKRDHLLDDPPITLRNRPNNSVVLLLPFALRFAFSGSHPSVKLLSSQSIPVPPGGGDELKVSGVVVAPAHVRQAQHQQRDQSISPRSATSGFMTMRPVSCCVLLAVDVDSEHEAGDLVPHACCHGVDRCRGLEAFVFAGGVDRSS